MSYDSIYDTRNCTPAQAQGNNKDNSFNNYKRYNSRPDRKTAQSLSGAEKEAADKDIRALKDRHAKMMSDYQTEFMNAAQSGNMEALTAMPQKFAEKMRAFQESVDAIADKYGIVINEAGASGKIASTKQDGNYDESDQNRYNSVTPLDKPSTSGKIKLENPNTDGGPGSGNFGHKGVPGQVGGSAPSGEGSSSGSSGGESASSESKGAAGGGKSSGASGAGSSSSSSKKEAGASSSGSSEASESSAPKVSARGANTPCTGFASKALFERHVKRHIEEFPDMDGKQYEQYAIDFLKQPCSEVVDGYRTKQGEIVRFDRANGEYAKGVPGGRVVTCYVARFNKRTGVANLEAANRYFDRLKETEGVE